MAVVIGLAVGLILAGLLILFLSGNAKYPLLVTVLHWVGIILVVVGLILLITPVLVWIEAQLRSMLKL